jgi:hypothetical protein
MEAKVGEASRRKKAREDNEELIHPMSPARFNLLSIGVRMALSRLMHGDVSYWSDGQEKLLGLISLDFTDKDYYWLIMARDRIGRFRACKLDGSIKSEARATETLLAEMAKLVREGIPPDFGFQGAAGALATSSLARGWRERGAAGASRGVEDDVACRLTAQPSENSVGAGSGGDNGYSRRRYGTVHSSHHRGIDRSDHTCRACVFGGRAVPVAERRAGQRGLRRRQLGSVR